MPGYVRFIFVPSGHVLPPPEERDVNALYFVEDTQQLYRGSLLIADHQNIDEFLEPYKIKDMEIVGDGYYIADVSLDPETGVITLVKGSDLVTKEELPDAVHEITAADENLAHADDITRWSVV